MKVFTLVFALLFLPCDKNERKNESSKQDVAINLVISFGSCNNQNKPNVLFDEILKNKSEVFIWGGDIIYSDTYEQKVLEGNYKKLKENKEYSDFRSKIKVLGTWDDHDYGLNDGGTEYTMKQESQQLFLDFLDVSKEDKRREQEGVYYSEVIEKGKYSVKIILLDTRYFRTGLTKDSSRKRRYVPNVYNEGTMLGEKQWKWLENELATSKSDFNILVSSIQVLSNKHGFEAWGNMPHEVDKLKEIIVNTKAKNVVILSGDRHISEVSKINIGKNYTPLIDFTSSGLTHAYTRFKGEENPFRVTNVVHEINFGLLKFDFENEVINFEIRGENNRLLAHYTQQY